MSPADERVGVLVTEDEALIGLDLCDMLESAGYVVIGPASTVVQSMRLLEQSAPRFAVIDVSLKDGLCTELAQALRHRNVPFLIQSGSFRDPQLVAALLDAPWLSKPVAAGDVLKGLRRLAEQGSREGRAVDL